jgi:hypothetical protein
MLFLLSQLKDLADLVKGTKFRINYSLYSGFVVHIMHNEFFLNLCDLKIGDFLW